MTWKLGFYTVQGPRKLCAAYKSNLIPNSLTETLGSDGD